MNTPAAADDGNPRRQRWTWLGALVAAVVIGTLALVLLVGTGGNDRPASSGAAAVGTSAAAGSSTPVTGSPPPTPTPAAGGSSAAVDQLPPSLAPVAMDATSAVGGVTVSLDRIEAIDGTATGPGNVSGPALRVTVRLENKMSEPLSLENVAVDLAYGPDALPAAPLDDPSVAWFSGTLRPGESARGIYVFTVPQDGRGQVTVSVGYQAGVPYAVFTGATD